MIKVAGFPKKESNSTDPQLKLKGELRQQFRNARARQSPELRAQAHQKIHFHLQPFLQSHDGYWASYLAMPDEVDLFRLAELEPTRWAFPVIYGESLQFFIPRNFAEMEPNRFGILEPRPSRSHLVSPDELTGVLVPGVAFDPSGVRLGQGQGFYDRALETYSGIKIGVAYAAQLSRDSLPHSRHDIHMTHLVTENGLVECRK